MFDALRGRQQARRRPARIELGQAALHARDAQQFTAAALGRRQAGHGSVAVLGQGEELEQPSIEIVGAHGGQFLSREVGAGMRARRSSRRRDYECQERASSAMHRIGRGAPYRQRAAFQKTAAGNSCDQAARGAGAWLWRPAHFLRATGTRLGTIPACRCLRIAPSTRQRIPLNIHLSLTPVISLIAGVLVLMMPKLLNYIVAFYLIAIGLIGILGLHQLHLG
jgi:hypothetical protein